MGSVMIPEALKIKLKKLPACPGCQRKLPVNVKFCPSCGKEIPHSTWRHNVNYQTTYKNSPFYHFIMSVLPKKRITEYEKMEGGFERDEEFMASHPDLQFALKWCNKLLNAHYSLSNNSHFSQIMNFYAEQFFKKDDIEPYDFAFRFDEDVDRRFDHYAEDLEYIFESEKINFMPGIYHRPGTDYINLNIFGYKNTFSEEELCLIPPLQKYMLSILLSSYCSYLRGKERGE